MSFAYHMYSSQNVFDVGNLTVLLEFDYRPGALIQMWSRRGNQGNYWHMAYIPLLTNSAGYKVW